MNLMFDFVEMKGAESAEFLHRITTNDLSNFTAGSIRHTLLVSDKGRIIDTVWVIHRNDALLLVVSKGMAEEVIPWLNKYIIMEEIELKDVSNRYSIQLKTDLSDQLYHTEYFGVPVTFELKESSEPNVSADDLQYEQWRIDEGIPKSHHEMVQDYNPLELNLWGWISFTKGCYIGQEVIARLDTYNKVQRTLCRISSGSIIEANKIIRDESGNNVGKITSVLREGTGSIGLAVIRSASALTCAVLDVDGTAEKIKIDRVFRKE